MAGLASGGKIFGIGLSKTGTTSLYAALLELGYSAGTFRHMKALRLADWLEGNFSDDYFGDYEALTDLPIGTYFRELDGRYPGSKFVLTVREIESWLDSICKYFGKRKNLPPGFNRDVRMATYGISGVNRERFRHVYEAHTRSVEAYFRDRPDDLLIIDIRAGHGWNELCPFLGREISDQPFPHVYPGFRPDGEMSTYRRLRRWLKRPKGR